MRENMEVLKCWMGDRIVESSFSEISRLEPHNEINNFKEILQLSKKLREKYT